MNFYRYNYHSYASLDSDGDFISPNIPNIKLSLSKFVLHKETPKGYWISYGTLAGFTSPLKWVSKTSKKRFAYPTKEEALNNLILRTKKRLKILEYQALSCKIALDLATDQLATI